MRSVQVYSHLNGLEYLLVHKPYLWEEICDTVKNVDASKAFCKISKERMMTGQTLYSPRELNRLFKQEFEQRGWNEARTAYYVSEDLDTTMETVGIRDKAAQKRLLLTVDLLPLEHIIK